jgi:hypothetical protein
MRKKAKTERQRRPASPDDYRRFPEESLRQCLEMPARRKRSRAVQLILAKAWDRLADQAEEWRRQHPPAAAA